MFTCTYIHPKGFYLYISGIAIIHISVRRTIYDKTGSLFWVYWQSKEGRGTMPVPSSALGPPTPSPLASVSPSLDPKGGGGGGQHSQGSEGLEDSIRTTGQKASHPVYSVLDTFRTGGHTLYCTVDPCGFLHRDSSNGQMGLQFKDEQI